MGMGEVTSVSQQRQKMRGGCFTGGEECIKTGEPGRDVMGSQVLLMGNIRQLSLFRLKRGKEEKV